MQYDGNRPSEGAGDTGDVRLGGVSSEGTAAGRFLFSDTLTQLRLNPFMLTKDSPVPTGFLVMEYSPVQVQTGIPESLAGGIHAA